MRERVDEQLSIVLLTYNCAHRIESILDRLIALGFPLIAVDNGSADGTAELLAARPEIVVIRLPHNLGAAGRNIGVQHVRTPYVAFCDDDGWYEAAGLSRAVAALQQYPRLALVNAHILVGADEHPDPISIEMAASPLPERAGIPGRVLLGFMAGAVIMRVDAYRAVGGYDVRFFIGGEEETLAMKLARAGWELRYRDDIVLHHEPSVANAPYLRAYGLRNTIWNCWLHRRMGSALRWTAFVLADQPKNADWLHGVGMALRELPAVLRRRQPMSRELDSAYAILDRRRFAARRPVWTRVDPLRALRTDSGRVAGTQRDNRTKQSRCRSAGSAA